MDKVRTAILVTVVSVLIWAFAEGQSVQTKRTEADIEFQPVAAGNYSVRLVEDQAWRGRVELLVEGSTASLDGLQSALRRPLRLSPGMDGIPRESGEHAIELRQALRGHPEFRTRGVTVISAEPATVRVVIDELTTIKAPIRVDAPAADVESVDVLNPAEVEVRLPARIASALASGATVVARVRPEDLARFEAGRRVTVRGVRLEAGPELAGVQPLEISPVQVDVPLTLRSKSETITLTSVPVDVRIAPAELARWEIDVPVEEQFLKDVQVTGPSEWIAQIREGTLEPRAYIRLSYEELERGLTAKQAEFTDLPSPLTIQVEDREIRFIVRARTPAGEELSPPE